MTKGDFLQKTEFLLFQTQDNGEDARVQVAVKDDTIWLSQKGMAELFGCSTDNISLHLKNIYDSGELSVALTAEEISVVRQEGTRSVNRKVLFYNLDAIISVGYRVNSRRATQFRNVSEPRGAGRVRGNRRSRRVSAEACGQCL